jgi:hypothetical protein
MIKRVKKGRSLGLYLWAGGLLGWVGLAMADVWDPADEARFLTTNELVHGSDQTHELGPGGSASNRDVDFFRIGERPLSSYEVVVDGVTNGIAAGLSVQRWNFSGPVQEAQGTSGVSLASRSLRWQNTLNSSLASAFVRVGSSTPCIGCSSAKSAYHIRSYDTTYSVPRFNNNVTQTTLLLVQNTSDRQVSGGVHFWSGAGALLGSSPFTLTPKQLLVQNTASLPFASGTSGSITVSHDGRYGDLAGKAVALEPGTGFTFETPLTPRPR